MWPWRRRRKPEISLNIEVVDYSLDYRLNALLIRLKAEEGILSLGKDQRDGGGEQP